MAETIETKIIRIKDAKNGNFDIALKNFPQAQPQEGVVQLKANVIQIRNAKNGDFDLVIPEDHTIEDALIENNGNADIVYYNDRITELHDYAFAYNKRFRVINLPNLTKVSNASQCIAYTSAEEIYLPRASGQSWNNAVAKNTNLKILDMGEIALTNIFRDNTALDTVIIRSTNVQSAVTSFGTCALLTTGGDVYVPQSLKASYEANSNWSQYPNITFHAIEGSEYEIEGLELTNNLSQSFSLNPPLNDTFDTPLEDEFIPTEELESEE